jgi:hypothetical protein
MSQRIEKADSMRNKTRSVLGELSNWLTNKTQMSYEDRFDQLFCRYLNIISGTWCQSAVNELLDRARTDDGATVLIPDL